MFYWASAQPVRSTHSLSESSLCVVAPQSPFLNFLLIGCKLQTKGVSKHQDCSLSLSSTKTEKAKTELSEMKPCLKRSSCLSIH